MNHSLEYLAYLVEKKNALNRKRRRFYHYMNVGSCYLRCDPLDKPCPVHGVDEVFKPKFARKMYKQAQRDMKAMTAHMREVQVQAGYKLYWGESGNILGIYESEYSKWGDRSIKVTSKQFKDLLDSYHFDSIVLK